MTKKVYESDVEQFSAWNRQLKTLLREADEIKKPNQEFGNEPDDQDEGNDEQKDDSHSDFIDKAGNLGNDLYSITLYGYDNDFADENPNSVIEGILEDIDNPVVKEFVNKAGFSDANNKVVSALILNDRNGEFVIYRAGKNVNEYSAGSVEDMVRNDVIERNQAPVLKKIFNAGQSYQSGLNKYYWKAGEAPEKQILSDLLEMLKEAIDVQSMPSEPKRIPDNMLSPEQQQKNKDLTDFLMSYMKDQINNKNDKKQGAGREKR